ncbi:MAG: hypothetical protein ABFD10_16245 [Prolixibacteraceae bacterium]
MEILLILAVIIIAVYFAFLPKKEDEEESQPDEKVNMENVRVYFKFPNEIETIFPVVEAYLETYKNTLAQYPLLVKPYAFMLAVRMTEQGRAGREFGVMAQGAIDTDLETQAEWTMSTLVKDTKRWYADTLANGKKKSDYAGFIFYFGDKWCPIGADNDPNNLNQYWIPNFQKYYSLFLP